MEIIRGKLPGAKKIVIYGPEGIGKSTFAAQFPEPLFIDTEGSTKDMDVARTKAPESWTMLMEQVMEIKKTPGLCKTLVIDTADWAEMLCITQVCSKNHKNGIEEFGYGKGYVYVQEEFGRLLNLLEDVVKAGVNVVLTAHAKMRKFEQPDELGAYDRWEMKLTKQTAPMVKEWADMVLFANYKTFVVNVDGQGVQKGKNKGQGGKRVMYTAHHSCWDAKNRYGLPEETEFSYREIAHIIEPKTQRKKEGKPPEPKADATAPRKEETGRQMEFPGHKTDKGKPEVPSAREEETQDAVWESNVEIPGALRELMAKDCVFDEELRAVVGARGYYPEATPIARYDPEFVSGVLVAAWPQVLGMVKEMRDKEEIPFD